MAGELIPPPHRPVPNLLHAVTSVKSVYGHAMNLTAHPIVLLAADLEARGFLAGVGKFLLFVIVVLVLIGVFIGFKVSKRRR